MTSTVNIKNNKHNIDISDLQNKFITKLFDNMPTANHNALICRSTIILTVSSSNTSIKITK